MADLRQLVAEEAIRQGIDPNLAVALMLQESGGNAQAVSKRGALGPMQLMPATATDLGVDPHVPEDNVRGGVTYLKQMLAKYGGDAKLALAAYNAGPGNVDQHGGIPPFAETQGYVRSVQARAARNPAAAYLKPQGGSKVAGNFFDQFDQQAPSDAAVPVGSNPFWRTTVGGVVRGLRDIPDAGAQLVTRGLEAVAPAGSDFEAWARKERENVESINRKAEAEYQAGRAAPRNISDLIAPQNPGFDWARMGGNIIGTLPVGALRAGGVVASGALQGATAGALQPVYGDGDNYWQDKGTQIGTGAVTGAAASYAADKVGKLIQGARRANAPAPQPAPATAPNAAQVNTGGRIEPAFGVSDDALNAFTAADESAGLNEAQKRLLDVGKTLGFRSTPSQASGSKSLERVERMLRSSPLTSRPFDAIDSNNVTALNKIAARSIGVDGATDVSEATLAKAADRFDKIWKAVADERLRVLDSNAAVDALAKMELDYSGMLEGAKLLDHPQVSEFVKLVADGTATGKQLQALSSQIGKVASHESKSERGNRALGSALFDVKELIDDALQQGLPPNLQAAFQGARGEYRNFITLLKPHVVNAGNGNVSGLNLANKLAQNDRSGFRLGRSKSDLYEAARWMQAFKPTINAGNDASRLNLNQSDGLMKWLFTLPTNAVAGAYTSRPVTAAARAAGTGLLPNSAGDAIAKYTRMFAPLTATQYEQGLLR